MSNVRKNLAIICQNRKLPFVFEEAEKLGIDITFFTTQKNVLHLPFLL